MRIYGGVASRRVFDMPRGRARQGACPKVRPLTALIRRSLFDALGARVLDAQVLDLFAGSGSFGLEALSRGARGATFVELDGRMCRAITEHLRRFEWSALGNVQRGDAERVVSALASQGKRYHLVFCDPPFACPWKAGLWSAVARLVVPGGLALYRHHVKREPGEPCGGFELRRSIRHGDSVVSWYQAISKE